MVDFGPGGEVVSERVARVGVLVEDDGVRDSGAKAVGDSEEGREMSSGRRVKEEKGDRGRTRCEIQPRSKPSRWVFERSQLP